MSYPAQCILTAPDVLWIRSHILQNSLDCAQVLGYGGATAGGGVGGHGCWNPPMERPLPQQIRAPRASILTTPLAIMIAALLPVIQTQKSPAPYRIFTGVRLRFRDVNDC